MEKMSGRARAQMMRDMRDNPVSATARWAEERDAARAMLAALRYAEPVLRKLERHPFNHAYTATAHNAVTAAIAAAEAAGITTE